MNSSKFFDFWFGKKFLLLIIIIISFSFIRGFMSFKGLGLKVDYTVIFPILIILIMFSVFITGFYFLLRSRGIRFDSLTQGIQEKKEIAKSYGLKPKRADWGLMKESDFYLHSGEKKIHFFPVVWHINPRRRYGGFSGGVLVQRKLDKRLLRITL